MLESMDEPRADVQASPQDLQALIKEATLILKEPLETLAGPLRTYRKRLQFIMRKIKDVDLEALAPSPEYPADQLQKMKLAAPEVLQTLLEAEQVCAELQHSVSGLDSRLAELLHWETEARELYQLLRSTDRQPKQQGQDPRAKAIISRGLQLEGQVVTEEQDLQMMVMMSQKTSPIQYLHASAMQGRVRAAVAQSQEAVGMLSSLGARRERSRSPPEAAPPSKVFIHAKGKPQHLRQPTQQPETFVPRIVVQEYRGVKVASPTSPPMPYSYAEAVMQTRTKSPPEGPTQIWPQPAAQKQHEPKQQEEIQQQQGPSRQTEREPGQHEQKPQQPLEEVQPQKLMSTQPQQYQRQQEQQQVEQQPGKMSQHQVHQQGVASIQIQAQVRRPAPEPHEQTSSEQPAAKKAAPNPQELQSRKAQAMKNRPWLQKPAPGDQKTPSPGPEQDSTQDPIQKRQMQPQPNKETVESVQVVSQPVATDKPHSEAQAELAEQPEQQQKEQQKQTQQPQHLQQQEQRQRQQQQKEPHRQKQKQQEPQKQQKQQTQPAVRQAQPDSDAKTKSKTATVAQPHPQTKPQSQPQPSAMAESKPQPAMQGQPTSVSQTTTTSHQPLKTTSQTGVSENQSQNLPQPHGPVKTQSFTQPQSQQQLQPQASLQPQGLPHGPAVVQVRPASPMQPSLQGQIQPPVPSHIQLRTHPQSWAPVRPPSPKPPTTQAQPQTHPQSINMPQTQVQPMVDPQIHSQPRVQTQTPPQPQTQSQIPAQSVAYPPTHSPSMAYPPTHSPSMAYPPTHSPAMAYPPTHSPSMAYPPTHSPSIAYPPTHSPSMAYPPTHSPSMAYPPGQPPSTAYPQTHSPSVSQAQTHPQPQAYSQPHPQSMAQPHTHAQARAQVQTSLQPQAYPQAPQSNAQPRAQTQGPVQPMIRPGQVQPLPHQTPMTQYPSHTQPQVQQQGHISPGQPQPWTQVRASSPMSIQHPQATQPSQLYPPGYPQAQSPSQQWTDKQEPQNQTGSPQRHPIPQSYPQQMGQAPQSQVYPPVQPLPQWAQQGPQVGPQGYSHMGQPYAQPQMQSQTQTQPWAQTQSQMRPQSPMQHPQMRPYNVAQTQQGQVQQQTWTQAPPQHPQPHQPESQQYQPVQRHPQPRMQTPVSLQSQPHQVQPKLPSQPQVQTLQGQPQAHMQAQAKPQAKTQQPQSNLQFQQPTPQPKHPSQPQPQQMVHPPTQVKDVSHPQSKPLPQSLPQVEVGSPLQPQIQTTTQAKPEPKPEPQLPKPQVELQPKVQGQTASQPVALSSAQPKVQSPPLTKAQTAPQSKTQSPPQAKPQTQALTQSKPQTQAPLQPTPQQPQAVVLSQVSMSPQTPAESPDICSTPPALAQVPPQAYTEAYAKAQALARNGFEEAKHCLQAHILEAVNVFKDKSMSPEQASVKEETLRTLDPEMLEEFLRAAKGMEAFCTPSQHRDMEFFTRSVRTQWEAVRAEISGFLQQIQFEVTRKVFNAAALRCEMHLNPRLEKHEQACFSADFAEAGQHLEALKELCDTLSPEDAHRLAQTQLRECENRLAAIQRQFSGDQEAPLTESRIPLPFSEDLTAQKEPTKPSDKPQVSAEVPPVTAKTVAVERREVEKQPSVEEEIPKKEALERYENYKRTLQAQLAKNDQSIKEVPSDSASLKGLHTRLQEIQFLRQETESLWSEYANQCSQLSGTPALDQEKAELQDQWRNQQSSLQRRGSSLGAALRQIDSTENHMVDFTDRLDRYLRQPKDITAFTLANTNILKDIKELDDNIQGELDQLTRLDPESSDLDPRERFPLTREVETHKTSLDQLRQQVRKSEAAARALDRFLMSLRTVDEDISGVQAAPCSDPVVLQECRSKLVLIRQSIDSLKEKAPQLDLLLQGARLTVTRDGVPASCLDMVTALLRRLEEADGGLAGQQKGLQKETQGKSLGVRKRILLGDLRKLKDAIETQGLKEPTIPAVQHRLRALSDLEGQLQAQQSELQSLRELQETQGGAEDLLQDVETQWKETHRAFFDSKKQCNALLELLKKFQSCRGHLSNSIQKAEQTIGDQASYMGKDNLQKSMTKVGDIKEELGGLGEPMEEMRSVCKQLQSELKKFPDCSETQFEAEAESLMDSWLDVTEKTDAYMDNLRVALELWEKQLMLGGEVDNWAGAKLALFAVSHPFHSEKQVLAMRDEIQANEETIAHFHKKSGEIQEMLQSQEAPLELQVMETQLRKRMEQVKELFSDCTDVFEELVAVKKHLSEKIEECQTAVENIQGCLSKVDASGPKSEEQIQDLCDDLDSQEEQAEAVIKEVGLISSVASPQVLEALTVDCNRLREAISRTKDMIHLKREERDKGLLKVLQDERQSFEGWFQDLQLAVNECFENPESRTDVETSVQRLTAFLKSKDAERRLEQLKDQLERGRQQVPPQQLSELSDWLKEQQKEVETFRTHCENRLQQMESLLGDLNSLQKQHDSFREWLQNKEKQSAVSEKVRPLLKELQDESGRADTLSELLASVRRQGVRAESLLKDGDNLIQRYRNLEARLQKQAEAQSVLDGEHDQFNADTESTRSWISNLSQPLTSPGKDAKTEEIKSRAQAVLSSKPEGDSKVNELRRRGESLCEQDDLEDSRRQAVQQSVRDTEDQWNKAVQVAEDALNKAETRALLDKDLDDFQTQNENVQSWIRDQDQSLKSLGGNVPAGEKLQIAQAVLSPGPEGESKLRDLKRRCQSLCDNQGLEESKKQKVQDSVKQTEEQWKKVSQAAQEAVNQAQTEAATEKNFDDFKSQSDAVQSWIKDQRQKLLPLGGHTPFEERLQAAQAVLNSKPEAESKLLDLKKRCEESRKPEAEQLVKAAEQQWTSALQAARQAELRSLSDDFDAQSKNTESWIRQKQLKLQSVGSYMTPEERCSVAQTILTSRPEGDCMVNNLRRRGQSLCDHRDADEGRKAQVQQTVRETEEQWRTVLQEAKQVEAAAGAQITEETERKTTELKEFDAHQQETDRWLQDLRKKLDCVSSLTKPEDRLKAAQAVVSAKPEGDSKLQKLKRQSQSLCGRDLDEPKKQEIGQKVRDAEERWARVLQDAKQAVGQAERQCALDGQLKNFESLRDSTRSWLREKQQSLQSLDGQTDPELTISTAQTILSCKPEGDSKLTELKRQSQSLSDQEDLEDSARREAQQTVKDSEEQWRTVLQGAEDTLNKAEVQYSLSRELEAFHTHADNTKSWVQDLQGQAESVGTGTQGSKEEIEDRLKTAQGIVSLKSNGKAQVADLKRRAQSLCDNQDLDQDKKLEVQQKVKDTEKLWQTVLQAAKDTQRQLPDVVDRLVSCENKRGEAEDRLADIQKQTSDLPRLFPWPGLGERRLAVDQARSLLDQSTALAPVLADVRTQAAELVKITKDQSWSDPSWAAKEESIPGLLKDLTDAVTNLEQGVMTERQCTQLLEQHEAAQDWLREQVKGLGPPPTDRQGLHSAVNTLKALLQTVDREQREMKELDSARDNLLSLCTPGGQDALTLEVGHLHDLCNSSEQEVRERLAACEKRLEELDSQQTKKNQGLKERAAALQWELRSLDQALSYSEPQNNMDQLQQHWNSLQNCEKSLEDLGVKVQDLHQEVKSASSTSELPVDITSGVESLSQQHSSLKSRLNDHQDTCSKNTAGCLTDCLHALQQWNHSKPSESVSSVQVKLEEGEKLKDNLQEALSHKQFLSACLTPKLLKKVEKESSETLREADANKASLSQTLKELDQRSKQKLPGIQTSDALNGNQVDTKTPAVAPPRKSKRSPEKKSEVKLQQSISSKDKPEFVEEKLSVSIEVMKEAPLKSGKVEITVEQITPGVGEPTGILKATDQSVPVVSTEKTPVPPRKKSKTSTTEPERDTSAREAQLKNERVEVSIETATAGTSAHVGAETTPVPSRRKSKTATETEPAQTKVEAESLLPVEVTTAVITEPEDTKVIPTRRKSKSAEPTTTSQKVAAPSKGTDEELVSLKSSTPQVKTEPTESIVVKESKVSPTKRRSKGPKLSAEHTAKEVAENNQEPGSQKPSVSSGEQTKMAVDETKVVPTRRKSKNLEGSTVPEPVSSAGQVPGVEPNVAKQELQKYPATQEFVKEPSEMTVGETNTFLPPKRKSKSTELGPSLADTVTAPTGYKAEGQKSKSVVTEETKVVPTRRKSRNGDPFTSSETVTADVRSPDVKPEQKEKEPVGPKSLTPDVMEPAGSTAVKEGKLSSMKVKPQKPLSEESETVSKEEKASSTPEVATAPTETTVMGKGKLSPTKRKSKGVKLAPEFSAMELAKSKEDPDSQKLTSTSEGITEPTEIIDVEKGKLSPTKRKSKDPKPSPKLSTMELTKTKEKPDHQMPPTPPERVSGTTEKGKSSPTKRKSKGFKLAPESSTIDPTKTKENPDSQKLSSTSEVVTAKTEITDAEKGKLSPTKRKSKGLKPSPESGSMDMSETKKESEPLNSREQTALEKTELGPAGRKSKCLAESKEMEKETESGKPAVSAKMATEPTKTVVVEPSVLSPTDRKSESPEVSLEVANKDQIPSKKECDHERSPLTSTKQTYVAVVEGVETQNTEKEHDSVKPVTVSEVVTEQTEKAVVEETKHIPERRKSKSPEVSETSQTSSAAKSTALKDPEETKKKSKSSSFGISWGAKSFFDNVSQQIQGLWSKNQTPTEDISQACEKTDSQAGDNQDVQEKKVAKIILDTPEVWADTKPHKVDSSDSQTPLTSDTAEVTYGPDYIEKLWKNTAETEKRYLVLDMPDTGVTQKTEIKPDQTEVQILVKCDSTQPAVSIVPQHHEAKTELSELSPTEQEIIKLSKTISQLRLSPQETPQEKVKKPEVRIIQLDLPPSPEKNENTSATTAEELRMDITRESKDETTTDPKVDVVETRVQSDSVQDSTSKIPKVVKEPSVQHSLESLNAIPTEAKELVVQEEHPKIPTLGVDDVPKSRDKKSVNEEKIHKGAKVPISQPDAPTTAKRQEITSVTMVPRIDTDKTRIMSEKVPVKQDLTSAGVWPERTVVQITMEEVMERGPQGFVEITISDQDKVEPNDKYSQLDPNKTAQERLKEVKDPGVQEQPCTVLTYDAPKSLETTSDRPLDEISVTVEKIHKGAEVPILPPDTLTTVKKQEITSVVITNAPRIGSDGTSSPSEKVTDKQDLTSVGICPEPTVVEITMEEVKEHGPQGFVEITISEQGKIEPSQNDSPQKPAMQPSIQLDKESTNVTDTDVQPEKLAAEITKGVLEKSLIEFLSDPSVIPKVQMDKHTADETEKKEDQQKKTAVPREERENSISVKVPLQTTTTITTSDVGVPSENLPKQQVRISPTPLQVIQKSSTHIIPVEVSHLGGLPSQENKADTDVVTTEKLVPEAPEGSTMRNIFTEIQLLTGTGPNSQLIEGKPQEEAPETLITSTSDLDSHLGRLVSKILSCKNRPAELSPAAMARQVEEVQECRDASQAQASLLSQLRGADPENEDALEHLEDKWSTAGQDAAAVIQSKEALLQLVTDYCRQMQAAKTALERQTAELDAVKQSPQESSSKEAEQLCSLQRSMEEDRTVLGELLMTHTKLYPHLSRCDRATTLSEQKSLQEKLRGLERTVEKNLHHTNAHSHQTSSLLSDLSGLQEHLETVCKDLESKSLSATQWNCKKAQQLMEANAEVKAAQQQYSHLQQLSEMLLPSSPWESDTKEIREALQKVKDKLAHTDELLSSQAQSSSKPIVEKIIKVMSDGLAWAKQTESDIEGRRKRVALLSEEVHRQLGDMKKLQSEVMAKQGQLESLVEEVTELLPQLDQAEEVPMVHTSLGRLEEVSKSTTEKLSKAVKDIESGLQTREKLSEQIADLDSWVVAHLQREASRSPDSELRSPAELDRRLRQIQETQNEADKQAAVCEALFMKSKDIASELSVTENCQLFDKLTNLQEDIRAISSYEKANKKELDDLIQTVDSSKRNLGTVEKSLRQMLVDLSKHRFPITRESLQALEPFKHMILDNKSQVDLLQPWIPHQKTKELNSLISELNSKMVSLEMKARDHERYLNTRQCVEDLRDNIQEQVCLTNDNSRDLEDRYKICQMLLVQFPLIKGMCEEASSRLQTIATDLYPSQLTTEQQRLKQNEESLDTGERTVCNNLSIIEDSLLKDLDLESERKSTQDFLSRTQQELQTLPVLEPNEEMINREYQRIVSLKKTVESRMRALEVLQQKKGTKLKERSGFQEVINLKNAVLRECDSQMENISQARRSLKTCTCAVKAAAQFLRDVEVSLLPPQGSSGPCCESLGVTQKALASLQQQFQIHMEKLQNQATLHPYLSPVKVLQLQENILSQLLVRMSTLQAKGHLRLESLNRCAEQHRNYTKRRDELVLSVKTAENRLLQLISQKVTCLTDCTNQEAKLTALSEETEALLRRLEELKEWCPEQSCRGGREAAVLSLWRRMSRLRRCTQELTTRSKQRVTEWSDITNSVEKASVVLEQVDAGLPDDSRVKKASSEELQDLLQSWEQYQDSLDCEHRALSALELRTARLQGVPAHLEQAPPTPLCQQLQAMQDRCDSVKQRSRGGLLAARQELEDREKVREELQGVRVWLEAANGLLSEMEESGSTQQLQEVYGQLCTQKALLQRVMESLKMKYSDMYSLVPVEIDSQMQEVSKSLQQVETKVGEAVQKSGPVHRLRAKLSEIQAGLGSVQNRLEHRSPNVIEAKFTQKRVWDELDRWHSRLAALEVEIQDLEKPEDALTLTEKLVEVQQLHSLLAKQAEQRTTLLSKIHTWLQEHQEMIKSSNSWRAEAQSWLAAPCTYTTAKCLSNHVNALQMVLDDSAQIRTTLQGFGSVLKEMSQVCDITTLQEQLVEADRQVADVQESFTSPLSQLEHAAAEVEAIESEVRQMESNVADIKTILSSPETFPSPREESLKAVEQRIQTMRRTVAEIQKCKPGLCLPEKAEETLTVFAVVDQLQSLLLELEKKVPALFIQQPPTPVQAKAPQPPLFRSTSEEAEREEEPGQIRIAHVEEDVLKRSGAALLTVERSSPEQRQFWTPESTWEPVVDSEEAEAAAAEQTARDTKDVDVPTDTTEASSPEALSKPVATVRTQSLPESMVNTSSTVNVSKTTAGPQQRCVVS